MELLTLLRLTLFSVIDQTGDYGSPALSVEKSLGALEINILQWQRMTL